MTTPTVQADSVGTPPLQPIFAEQIEGIKDRIGAVEWMMALDIDPQFRHHDHWIDAEQRDEVVGIVLLMPDDSYRIGYAIYDSQWGGVVADQAYEVPESAAAAANNLARDMAALFVKHQMKQGEWQWGAGAKNASPWAISFKSA